MRQKTRPWLRLFFCLAIVVAGLAAGCERRREPIRIGLAINLSGRGGIAGEHIRDGALLAVADINRKGGIHGRPLQLLVEDDLNTREGILAADAKLIDAGVIAIIGHSNSENTVISHSFVTSRNTLLFTSHAATTKLADMDDLFCRTSVDNKRYGQALASLLRRWGVTRASFLLDMSNPSFVEDLLEQVAGHYAGRITAVRFNSTERVAWDAVVDKLLAPRPQAVILLSEATMTGIGAQKLRSHGFKGRLIASLWAQSPELCEYGGNAVDGLTIITFIDPDNKRLAYRAFSEKRQQQFKKPATSRAAQSYEAIQILAQALQQCSAKPSAEELKAVLLRDRFETLMGPVRFNEFCDVSRPIYEVRLRDKKFHTIGPMSLNE